MTDDNQATDEAMDAGLRASGCGEHVEAGAESATPQLLQQKNDEEKRPTQAAAEELEQQAPVIAANFEQQLQSDENTPSSREQPNLSQPLNGSNNSNNSTPRLETREREDAARTMEMNNNQQPPQQQQRPPLLVVRDRLFRALFYRVSLGYARAVPWNYRIFIEWFVLLKAVLCLSILIYVQLVFTNSASNCLQKVEKEWPRDGILRVEIIRNTPENYTIFNSYKKEFHNIQLEDVVSESQEKDASNFHRVTESNVTDDGDGGQSDDQVKPDVEVHTWPLDEIQENGTHLGTVVEIKTEEKKQTHDLLLATLSEFEMLISIVWPEERYIVEYSLEYGLLRLSPKARQRLNVTVMLITLDPVKDECFGSGFARFLFDEFLGYDNILMSSIKRLAEQESGEGYLRNVVTGEHFRFVSLWMAKASFAFGSAIMILCTLVVAMLLRYSHHQIFVFILDILQMLEFNRFRLVPAVPLLTVVLALVGMEKIMSRFFNDTTTAFYVILIVWIADQYDAICCHSNIGRRHWLRFFFLYHFAFYVYHYRFNGQFSGLALLTSWLFTMHSMIFFFHHYELPAILQQANLPERVQPDREVPEPQRERNGAAPQNVEVQNDDENPLEEIHNLVTELRTNHEPAEIATSRGWQVTTGDSSTSSVTNRRATRSGDDTETPDTGRARGVERSPSDGCPVASSPIKQAVPLAETGHVGNFDGTADPQNSVRRLNSSMIAEENEL